MAGRRHQFRGQFGINETALTLAIRNGEYESAEEKIEATTDLAYLNDGQYQNVPLLMVLTNNYCSGLKRNLKLAKILVQKGANPNLRIPLVDFDRTSPSPFEELVVCYEALRYFVDGKFNVLSGELEMYVGKDDVLEVFVNNTIDLNGICCTAVMDDCERLLEQTSKLMDIFLENGANPSVATTFRQKTLFHWIIEHDIDLGKRFLNTCRVNINISDVHGNSPLMGAILRNEAENSLCLYETMCEMIDKVDVNISNCVGETALFRSCFVGAVEFASKLCDDGAVMFGGTAVCPSRFPTLDEDECWGCVKSLPYVCTYLPSPLLAPLLSDATARLRYEHIALHESLHKDMSPHKHLTDKIIMSSVSPVVDSLSLKCQSGHKDTTALTSGLDQMTSLLKHTDFSHLRDGRIPSLDLSSLMFGQLSAGLRHLCIRKIFDHVLMVSRIPKKMWPDYAPQYVCFKGCKRELLKSYMSELVELLQLPQSFQIFFDIEAAKYQLCKIVTSLQCLECQEACSQSDLSMYDDDESDSSYPSDLSTDYSASILFSSDILSEESSEELDDLSDEFSGNADNDDESDISGCAGKEVKVRRKVRCDYENLSSSSENIRVIVETLCEDVAENMAQQHHKSECQGKYQRLNGDCSNSPTSNKCTSPSSSSSELAVKLSAQESPDSP